MQQQGSHGCFMRILWTAGRWCSQTNGEQGWAIHRCSNLHIWRHWHELWLTLVVCAAASLAPLGKDMHNCTIRLAIEGSWGMPCYPSPWSGQQQPAPAPSVCVFSAVVSPPRNWYSYNYSVFTNADKPADTFLGLQSVERRNLPAGVLNLTLEWKPLPGLTAEMVEWMFGNLHKTALSPFDNKTYPMCVWGSNP